MGLIGSETLRGLVSCGRWGENTWIEEATFFKSIREEEGMEEGLICMNLEPLRKDRENV